MLTKTLKDDKAMPGNEMIPDIAMDGGKGDDLADMARFVSALRKLVTEDPTVRNPYPVLGAAGFDFFLEIADGAFRDRRIITTIHITLGNKYTDNIPPISIWADGIPEEIQIGLPDASQVIALAGLLEKSLGAGTAMLHPLTRFGDFLEGWADAVAAVTDGGRR